ncbi:von Willebrand factor A domain-containing protein 5A-like isoform X2 [Stigmatopora nigra]
MEHCCGLLTPTKEAVPLKGIDVDVEVKDHVAVVVSTLHYENKEDKAIEAIFVFPLPGDAAVCQFSAKIGQTEIVAEVKEKQEAREEYDDALSSGQQAFLLEESNQSPDIFSLSVGSLPPGESASIRLEYVTELAVEADGGLRFCLPAVLNPRYQPQGSNNDGVQIKSVPASLVPYSLSFSALVSSPRRVSKVDSKCSLEPLQYLDKEQTQAVVKLAAGHKFDRDLELFLYYMDTHQPAVVVEAGKPEAKPGTLMGDTAVMVSVYPEFPQSVTSSLATSGEFVFVLDRSGSMDCAINESSRKQTRISSARDTLLLLLKSLPMGCYFNIYSFGSTFEHLFPKSVEYSQTTMEDALKKVGTMDADLGGTEILECLKNIYSQPCITGQPRQLFVFTDGEVGNTKEVIKLVKKHSNSHRCFSFGIGDGASTALINGLAREGGGHAQFIAGTDRMQPKVMQSLRFALQPAVEDISMTWDLPKEVSVTVLSPPLTTIFHGRRSLIYAQLTGQSLDAKDGCVTLKYSLVGQPIQNQLRFALQPKEDTGLTIHRLSARTAIRSMEIEDEDLFLPFEEAEDQKVQHDELKKKVVELSVQSGVSSSYTAFVAVCENDNKKVKGPLLRQTIPISGRFPLANGCNFSACPPIPCCLKLGAPVFQDAMMLDCDMSTEMDSFQQDEEYSCEDEEEALQQEDMQRPPSPAIAKDPLLQMVSLQKASGHWLFEEALASVLGKTSKELETPKPAAVSKEVWATILALIWLHGLKSEAQDEWQLLAMKAGSWLRSQKISGLVECVAAANTLLGCKVHKDVLGI